MERIGHIYMITNTINGKQYIGQTIKSVQSRWTQHLSEARNRPERSNSRLYQAIKKYGSENFSIKTIENTPIEQLNEREKYWIAFYNTQENGYNILEGGQIKKIYPHIIVEENGLVFDSCEELARLFQEHNVWSARFSRPKIHTSVETGEAFLGYHLKADYDARVSNEESLIKWIKTIKVEFSGKQICCIELQQEFESIGQAAVFLLNNNLYTVNSSNPKQAVVSLISNAISKNKKIQFADGKWYTFKKIDGQTTKQKGNKNPFCDMKIYCPQIDRIFDSQLQAAEYFVNNNVWSGIVVKTARCRISDIIRGNLTNYRGYTFKKIENN